MEDIRIPFILWFWDDAQPSLTKMSEPIMLTVWLHSDVTDLSEDNDNSIVSFGDDPSG